MKVKLSHLRKMIREAIEEVATPGDSRYGMTGDARGGVPRGGSDVYFPGHDMDSYSEENVQRSQGLSSPGQTYVPSTSQGLSSPGGSYVNGVGWVPSGVANAAGDEADSNMGDGASGADEKEYFLVIDSNVTRGKPGDIMHVDSGNVLTVRDKDQDGGALAMDLYNKWQMGGRKNAKQRSEDILSSLMKHGMLQEEAIDDELIDEIGVRGSQTGQLYDLEDYFAQFNNGLVKECRKIMKRILN